LEFRKDIDYIFRLLLVFKMPLSSSSNKSQKRRLERSHLVFGIFSKRSWKFNESL